MWRESLIETFEVALGPEVRAASDVAAVTRLNRRGHVLAAEHGLPAFDLADDVVVGGVYEIRDSAIVELAVRGLEQLCDASVDRLELLRRDSTTASKESLKDLLRDQARVNGEITVVEEAWLEASEALQNAAARAPH